SKGWHWARVLKFLIENKRSLLAGLLITLLLGGYWFFKSYDIIKSYLVILQKVSWLKLFFIGALLLLAVIVLRRVFKKFNALVFTRKNRMIIVGFIIVILLLVGYGIYTHQDLAKPLLKSYKSPATLIATPAFYEEYPMMKILKSRFLSNILLFPYRIKDIGLYTSYTPDFLEKSGFGVQFFGFGLLAYLIMIVWCIAKKSFRNNSVGFILSFSIILLMSYFVYYYTQANYRLFMFFPVFGMILWAFLTKALNFSKYSLRFLDFLILVMLLFNLSTCFFEGNMNGAKWKTLFTIDNPLERTSIKYSTFFNGKFEAWKFIDSYISPEEPIGYIGYHDSWVFPYFDNQLKRKIHHLPAIPGFRQVEISPDTNRIEFSPTFLKELQHRNIHFIHINPQGIRHFNKSTKYRIIDNNRFQRVTKGLYYYKW
ncbi:MAG: hypothetical protein GY940_26090, partial [bacterium]|nr:hypothetical protein [bacterium]